MPAPSCCRPAPGSRRSPRGSLPGTKSCPPACRSTRARPAHLMPSLPPCLPNCNPLPAARGRGRFLQGAGAQRAAGHASERAYIPGVRVGHAAPGGAAGRSGVARWNPAACSSSAASCCMRGVRVRADSSRACAVRGPCAASHTHSLHTAAQSAHHRPCRLVRCHFRPNAKQELFLIHGPIFNSGFFKQAVCSVQV